MLLKHRCLAFRRSQTVCAFGSQPERIANVRTGALSLEVSGLAIAAVAAAIAAAAVVWLLARVKHTSACMCVPLI